MKILAVIGYLMCMFLMQTCQQRVRRLLILICWWTTCRVVLKLSTSELL